MKTINFIKHFVLALLVIATIGTANATVNLIVTQNTPVTGTFTNTLNIPDFNVTSINFYGGGRDTLILKGNKLTS